MASRVYLLDPDSSAVVRLERRLGESHAVASFTGLPALARAAELAPPDAIVAVLRLPDQDSISSLEPMLARDPDLVLLLATAAGDERGAAHALARVGWLGQVDKPYDAAEVVAKLAAGLERRALRRELATATAIVRERESALVDVQAEAEHATRALAHTSSELATATERLARAEQLAAVGRVMTGITHEISTQLALVGFAEAIRARVQADPELGELAEIIVNAQKRLCAMVGQIRDFAVPGPARLAREPSDVVALVDEAVAILRFDRDVRERKLDRRYLARPLALLHHEKFSQVVQNLLSNAALATAAGDTITLELDQVGEVWHLTVSDSGCGMTPEVLARLGEPFFTTRGDRGSGLGVGICMRIIEEHGGSLTFCSEPGQGTQARIRLPVLP